jgi:hypothetical protein
MALNNSRYLGSRPTLLCGICLLVGSVALTGVDCPFVPDGTLPGGNTGLTGKFVGAETCSGCHANIHSNWSNTLHARALETLEALGQGSNPNCVGCHSVGFGEEGGFVDRATTNALAGVGCEACHGPAGAHATNVTDATLRPPVNIAASVCGKCHTGSHHPNFEDWASSGHAMVTEHVADSFTEGRSLNSCGACHSGDFFYRSRIKGETVADDLLMGVPREEQNGITCVICHMPHQKTGNAPEPEDGRDYQLRFPEAASPTPTNTIDAATDPTRLNVCGQCHHSRGKTWVETSRGPHHSVQANVYIGEMPMPDADAPPTPLVPSRVSVHSFATEQCGTCHLYRQDFMDEQAPAISGHVFMVNTAGCASAGCHPSTDAATAALATLQAEIQTRLDDILTRLGDPANWEYTSDGGPNAAGQALISDNIKKVRFLYHYTINDGSLGIHNPAYVRDMMTEASDLLTDEGL